MRDQKNKKKERSSQAGVEGTEAGERVWGRRKANNIMIGGAKWETCAGASGANEAQRSSLGDGQENWGRKKEQGITITM